MKVRQCTTCKINKKAITENFRPSRLGKYGLRSTCRPCERKYNSIRRKSPEYKAKEKVYMQTDKGKLKAKRGRVKNIFGISLEEYDSYFDKYKKCMLCDSTEKLCLDHCHNSLKIRGVLCSKCNTALGMVNDSIETLEKAIIYLKENGNAICP